MDVHPIQNGYFHRYWSIAISMAEFVVYVGWFGWRTPIHQLGSPAEWAHAISSSLVEASDEPQTPRGTLAQQTNHGFCGGLQFLSNTLWLYITIITLTVWIYTIRLDDLSIVILKNWTTYRLWQGGQARLDTSNSKVSSVPPICLERNGNLATWRVACVQTIYPIILPYLP